MRFLVLCMLLCIGANHGYSQSNPAIEFEYDANGNRIRRFLSVEDDPNGGGGGQRVAPPAPEQNQEELLQIQSGFDVKVYPNPFEHLLQVQIAEDVDLNQNIEYVLTDQQGHLVLTGQLKQHFSTLHVGFLAKGVYTLSVYNGGYRKSFLITKHN